MRLYDIFDKKGYHIQTLVPNKHGEKQQFLVKIYIWPNVIKKLRIDKLMYYPSMFVDGRDGDNCMTEVNKFLATLPDLSEDTLVD